MTEQSDGGRYAEAVFSFYAGRVGVREREDHVEAAYFGRTPNVRTPVDGTLDGQVVRVIEIQSRPLLADGTAKPGAQRAITLTIVSVEA